MTWIEPITDRTQADLTVRTPKAFFNIVDWDRIYGNILDLREQILSQNGVDTGLTLVNILFALDDPSTTDTVLLVLDDPSTTATFLLAFDESDRAIDYPMMDMFPAAEDFNALIVNINNLQKNACLPLATGVVPLEHNFAEGAGATAPNYQTVNGWELSLALMHQLLPNVPEYYISCGVATAGQQRFWQTRFR